MYLLLNREEVVTELAKRILAQKLKRKLPDWPNTMAYLNKMKKRQSKTGLLEIDFVTVNTLLKQDIVDYKDSVATEYKCHYRSLSKWLADNFDRLEINRAWLTNQYVKSSTKNFVKTVGSQLTENPVWVVAGDEIPDDQNVLIRNIINNEHVLKHRMANHLPFWFIDSGYTNFLTGKKTWHRLTKNHIHHSGSEGSFPADRLRLFSNMPRSWRQTGHAILVVENSNYHYEMFGTTLKQWRKQVMDELKMHTDRPVVFRSKGMNRKIRDNLYEHLQHNDYYCVVVDASAAAIEAIWAGVPVITLNRHISNTVTRNKLSEVNDLYRGNIGDWLCALSYSQFTQKELYDGTALKIIEKYHA